MNPSRILVVDDEADIRQLLQEILAEEGYDVEVAADAREARSARARQQPDLVLLDIWMPDTDGISLLREWSTGGGEHCPVVMLSGHGTIDTAVEATRLGAVDFIEKPLSLAKLLSTVERALETPRRQSVRLGSSGLMPPLGRSRLMQQLRADLSRLAAYPAPLLLLAESGSEPEALARYVHRHSPRSTGAFVVVPGKVLDDALALSTLCGTAAQPGLLERAGGGTLYLGNFEDLPDAALRLIAGVMESGAFQRSGSGRVPCDARVIATALPGVETRCSAGVRQELYAQLAALPVRVPPLREYAEDVPELLRTYIDELTEAENLPFRRAGVAAQNRLRNYPWPGNLRELRNLVRRLLLRGGSEEIALQEVESELGAQAPADGPLVKQDLLALPMREAREHFERAYLTQQLQLCEGRVGLLAKRVGMERTHLYRKLRSLGIEIGHGADD
ncbi:MAG: sigma-54-dependent Fis family transcriptional regulator [Gammaproteobacteria bacterium]|nr:sigma-54-dependent Fis family transcriptional regulator [Gammaproteobacteria bacterium]